MGRKGTNKPKSGQGKSKASAGEGTTKGIPSIVHATEIQPAKSIDIGKNNGKPSSDRKKPSMKG